ncbi:hypothetical protein FRC03_010827 [Tulasnella sp. 419]|nr:hypothetical protein FRC03_010827 [Tulasnella sp. 419]
MSLPPPLSLPQKGVSLLETPSTNHHPNLSPGPSVGHQGRSHLAPTVERSRSPSSFFPATEQYDEEKALGGETLPTYAGSIRPGTPYIPYANGVVGQIPITHVGSNETAPSTLDKYPEFWNSYNIEADREDREMMKSYAGDLDTLLIFAGLFSATNTAFIMESYKDLKQDPSELTNNLLRNLMRTIHQSAIEEADLLLDAPSLSPRAVRVNSFFFTSLSCSLFAAFGAVIGKQWLNHYEREGEVRDPYRRGIERHRKYVGLTQWRFQAVVEILPTLLQLSLFFFFIGLVDFLWPLNGSVASLVTALAVLTALFFIVTLLIGIFYPNSPFQTRLISLVRDIVPKSLTPESEDQTKQLNDVMMARCVDWLKQRTTVSSTIGVVARAIVLLTEEARRKINLGSGGDMLAYLLRSSVYHGRVYLAIPSEGLQSSLLVLRDLIKSWKREEEIVHPGDINNKSFLDALSRELWNLVLKSTTMDEMSTTTALDVIDQLGRLQQVDSRHTQYLLDSLGVKTSDRFAQLIRLNLLHDAVWAEDHLAVRSHLSVGHMPEVLATTMWSLENKEPDVDHRRTALRLSWLIEDMEHVYPQVENWGFSNYLLRWRNAPVPVDSSTSIGPIELTKLYLRTLICLLTRDEEKWSKELHRDNHLSHLKAISTDEGNAYTKEVHLYCWISFILLSNLAGRSEAEGAPLSEYYSQDWVDIVVRRMRSSGLSWVMVPRSILKKPEDLTHMMKSVYTYLTTAEKHGMIASKNLNVAFDAFRNLGKRMEVERLSQEMNYVWNRDVQILYHRVDEQADDPERQVTDSIVQIQISREQEFAPELTRLVNDLENIKAGQTSVTPADADRVLRLLQHDEIDKNYQSLAIEYLAHVLLSLPQQDVAQIVTRQTSSSTQITHLLLFTMWQIADVDPRLFDKDVRESIVDRSVPSLELRRIWLQYSPKSFHIDFHQAHFVEYLSVWYDVNQKQSEPYLKAIAMLVDVCPDIWLLSLEQEGHVRRVAALINPRPSNLTSSKKEAVRWIALRVFLNMWRRQSEGNDRWGSDAEGVYFNSQCSEAVEAFLTQLNTQIRMDSTVHALDALPKSMTALDFIKAGASYLRALSEKHRIDVKVIEGFELCTDPLVSGASRMENYSTETKWKESIRVWMEMVAGLREAL